MKKILFVLLILTIVFTSVFTGCSLLPLPTSSNATSNTTNTASASPLSDGKLNLYDMDPTTLDPAVASETTSAQYILQIYSGLLQLDDQMKPVGDIAQTWDLSSDGLTYTFHLRPDVKFQNGKVLTASDFKYSWERAANPATGSQTAATYLGDINGVNNVLSGAATQISGVKVVDNQTLQVTLNEPKSYFLYKLTYPTTFVLNQDVVKSGGDWWSKANNGAATGPFKLTEWTKNQSLTLKRNDSYYGPKPQLSQVNYQFYTGLPMDLYETDQIDVAGVSVAYKDAVMDQSGPFYKDLAVTPALGFYYIGFNCAEPPFDDANVRKAFSLAVDKDKIISLIYRDMEEKANGILPPGMPGYNQNIAGTGYDVNKAKDSLKSSKYGDASRLPSITLTTSGYGGSAGSVLQAIVYQWKQNLGVDVKIRQLEPERYYYNTKDEIDQVFEMGWSADYPHPQDFIDILFNSQSNYNYGRYSNSVVDNLIQQANRTANADQSLALYQQAEQKIIDDTACIPISFSKNYTLIRSYVKGYIINPLGFANLSKVSILPH